MYDCDFPFFVKLLNGAHVRVKSQLFVYWYNLILWDTNLRASVAIVRIGVRDYGVLGIIGSGQLKDHYYRIFLCSCHFGDLLKLNLNWCSVYIFPINQANWYSLDETANCKI